MNLNKDLINLDKLISSLNTSGKSVGSVYTQKNLNVNSSSLFKVVFMLVIIRLIDDNKKVCKIYEFLRQKQINIYLSKDLKKYILRRQNGFKNVYNNVNLC